MYSSYIIECPAMTELYWDYIQIKYPDDPSEVHESTQKSLSKLNHQLAQLTSYLKEILDEEDFRYYNYDEFTEYVLTYHPAHLDSDVVVVCLKALESVFHLLCSTSDNDFVILDRYGSLAVVMEC